jgi:hypothetical protein
MAFAVKSGDFSDPTVWDTGVVPIGSEDAYANGFTIQITGTVNIGRVRNDASNVYFINTAIPIMTSNSTPSGQINVTSQRTGGEGWRAFDRNLSTAWQTPDYVSNGTLTYRFPAGSPKVIKRYMLRVYASAQAPRIWTFQGSTNGTVWTDGVGGNPPPLDSVSTSLASNSTYTSSIINTGNVAYEWYRIVVTTGAVSWPLQIVEIEMTESTSTVVGQIPGGTFNLTAGSTLNCSASTGVVVGSTTPTIICSLGATLEATVNANIPSVAANAGYRAVLLNGLGKLNFTGNISYGLTSATGSSVIQITAQGILNYTGNCTNGGNSSVQCNSIYSSAAATIEINTPVFSGGSNGSNANASVWLNAGGNLTITGSIIGSNSPAVVMVGVSPSGGTITVTGNITAGASAAIVNITNPSTIITQGAVIPSSTANAIIGLGLVRVIATSLNNINTFQAVWSPRITIESTTTSMAFQKIAGGADQIMQIGAIVNSAQPAIGNVRSGVTYGVSPNEFTGIMEVPPINTVSLGVPVDLDKVGTFLMTPASFVVELNTSSQNVAVRLRNSATVSTIGAQIASYTQ